MDPNIHAPSAPLSRLIAVGFLLLLALRCQAEGARSDARGSRTAASIDRSGAQFTTAATNRLKPEWLKPSTEAFRLGPGDKLELEMLGRSGTRATTFVCPDGKIYYDLSPGLDVWGSTVEEAARTVERELGKYYAHPQVSPTLTAVESKRVWVMGRLDKSGVYPLHGPMTLIEAIARAGGLFTSRFGGTTDELADLNHSFIVRGGVMLPVDLQRLLRRGDTSQNLCLEPDDFIFLPSSLSSEVHVPGAVNGPRPVDYVDDMTPTTAIAKASARDGRLIFHKWPSCAALFPNRRSRSWLSKPSSPAMPPTSASGHETSSICR